MTLMLPDHIPPLAGRVALARMEQDVDIWRDQWGIPHIKAQGLGDAFRALGFVHAQDRLWQMEALRRRGTGRYAEWVGQAALKADILARQLDTAGASRRDYAALGADARAMLDAYADGVNAFIGQEIWPAEYTLLETTPERWEPWHSIAVQRQIGFLMGSVWWKLWRAALPILGPEGIAKLRFDDGGRDLLCIPPGVEIDRYVATLAELRPGIEALLAEAASDASGGGSNNWALSPERTATGRPLLAGDPHRVLEMPNMYAQTHLACDAFDVIGLTVPGVPGFPHFAHTADVAWCVTHTFVDIHDLYVERFDEGARHYLCKGDWRPAQRRSERVAVRGAADVAIKVVETPHGPVIAGDPAKGNALTIRSVQFAETDRSFDCMLPMLRARTVAELYEATRDWGLIDHNLVAGDTKGHIGHRVRAKVPRRPRSNGWLPVPGWTGEHEWQGMVEFERMPCTIDPPGGTIVTANNRVVDEGEDYLCTDAMPPHRARRIWQRLGMLDKAAVADMAPIHRDVVSIPGCEMRERLRTLSVEHGAAADLRQNLLAWNGEMEPGSTGAASYAALRAALTRLVAERSGLAGAATSPYTQVPPGILAESQLWWTVPQLLRANDIALLGGKSWDDLLREALGRVAQDPPASPWSVLHRPKLEHALSLAFPEHGALLDRPSAEEGGDNDTVFATGYSCARGPRALYASLCRYVYDVGAWENCRWITFHGASGHPGSPWYDNQNAIWAAGEMVPMLYDWSVIAAQPSAHMQLGAAGNRPPR
jgi:penicillin amidase